MYINGGLQYLKYRLLSGHSGGHGIHSPFVFDLVSRVFRNKISPDVVLMIEEIRKRNTSDNSIIYVSDLGAGSVKMKSNSRKVSEIARNSAVPVKYGILLANLASEYGRGYVIEFGTSLGFSTMYMAAAARGSVITSMEGCSTTAGLAKENFSRAGLENIRLLTGSFDELLPELKKDANSPGFVFIDGNHRKEPVVRYFSELVGISDEQTVIALDDIHSSSEMAEAWQEIIHHEKVTATVDIFRMGIVFFRKGVSMNNYIIRY